MNANTQPQTTARLDCLCGCGQTTSTKANYRPGHDAAHVSNLLADVIAHGDLSQNVVDLYKKALPSLALQIKFQRAVDNYADRASRKRGTTTESRTEWVECDTDEYKIGRWTYPVLVKMYKEGMAPKGQDDTQYLDFKRNTKRDGSGEWVALEGGELVGR